MRQEKELRESLRAGTSLIVQASRGAISIADFIEQYANFYYEEALDGHEEDAKGRQLLSTYEEVIAAHEAAQTTVVDLTFVGPDEHREQYEQAGRITVEQAQQRIEQIASRYDLDRHLMALSAS